MSRSEGECSKTYTLGPNDYAELFCLAVLIYKDEDEHESESCEGLVLELVSPGRSLYKPLGKFVVFDHDNDGDRSWLDRNWKADEQTITLI